MPQLMSTPTAAGMITASVAMTLPTVDPLPTCASGMRASGVTTNGIDAVARACANAAGPRVEAQDRTVLSSVRIGLMPTMPARNSFACIVFQALATPTSDQDHELRSGSALEGQLLT